MGLVQKVGLVVGIVAIPYAMAVVAAYISLRSLDFAVDIFKDMYEV